MGLLSEYESVEERLYEVGTCFSVLCADWSSIAIAFRPTKVDQPVEDIVTLSSVQFATHFELMKQMLEGGWDEKVYQHFRTTIVSSTEF